MQDIRYAGRTLTKSPGFLTIAVLTLALGIGANVALFSVVNAVLLRPLPFPDPDRLVRIFADFKGPGAEDVGLSEPEFEDLRDRAGVFDQITVVFPASAALTGGDHAERVELLVTSPSYFHLLGAKPALGRVYGEGDAKPGFSESVVISDALWQRQFGGAPDVIGRIIRVDEDPYAIVGVMPPDFRHPGRTVNGDVDMWVAAGYKADPFPNPPVRARRFLPGAIGRLSSGITIQQAQARLDALVARLRAAYPQDYPGEMRWSLWVEPAQETLTGKVRAMLMVLLAAVGFVLLIVCVNLASLLMARSSSRAREIAIRLAVGASRRRIVRQVLTESVLVSVAGGVVAVVVLTLLRSTLLALMPADLPRLSEVHYDSRVMALAFLLSLATGLLFGLTPALQASSFDPNIDLKEGGRTGGVSRRQNRLRSLLISGEIALSVMLSIGAGLLIRSFWHMSQVSPGMDPNNVVLARIWIPVPNNPKVNHYLKTAQREALIRELLRKAGALADLQDAAMGSGSTIPFLANVRAPFQFLLPDASDPTQRKGAEFAAVSPNYLRVLKAPLLRGRFFTEQDSAASKRVVVVNEAFVRKYFPRRNAIGRRMLAGLPLRDWEIVGVMGDLRGDGLDSPALPHVYFSIYQNSGFELALFLRTKDDAKTLKEPIGRVVHSVDPELPVYGIRTMEDVLFASTERRRFSLFLMSAFAALALLLAAIGIYGLMALAVSQRSQEFGIRMALGAQRRDVLVAAVWPGMILTLIGVAAGLTCAAGATRTMSSLLFGVSPNDPLTFAAVPVLLGIVALAACFLPAQRAARLSPVQALRC
ncbi:MAG: ABC transporter permease [Acidobacteriaceae bacterium]|nr:ABC transporter permease [Acidobacteriaceae bacterium]